MPASTTERYPTRSTMRAPRMEQATQPMTKGMRTNPACMALLPVTACRKSGTYEMAPNMAMPERKPVTAAARTMGRAKRVRGTTGSAAECSIQMNAISSAPESAMSPSTEPRIQLSPRPASTRPMSRLEMAAVKTAVPR